MDDAQVHDISVLTVALRDLVQDYLETPTATHEGARAALSLVLSEVQEVIRWKSEVALADEGHNPNCSPYCEGDHPPAPTNVDISVEQSRYVGPV